MQAISDNYKDAHADGEGPEADEGGAAAEGQRAGPDVPGGTGGNHSRNPPTGTSALMVEQRKRTEKAEGKTRRTEKTLGGRGAPGSLLPGAQR